MPAIDGAHERVTRAIRGLARGWSVASVGLVLAFVVGEGVDVGRMRAAELVGFLFFPLGVCAGMALAWRREGLGGAVTVGSLAAFYLVHLVAAQALPRGLAWLAFAAPGFLFLAAWHRSRQPGGRAAASAPGAAGPGRDGAGTRRAT